MNDRNTPSPLPYVNYVSSPVKDATDFFAKSLPSSPMDGLHCPDLIPRHESLCLEAHDCFIGSVFTDDCNFHPANASDAYVGGPVVGSMITDGTSYSSMKADIRHVDGWADAGSRPVDPLQRSSNSFSNVRLRRRKDGSAGPSARDKSLSLIQSQEVSSSGPKKSSTSRYELNRQKSYSNKVNNICQYILQKTSSGSKVHCETSDHEGMAENEQSPVIPGYYKTGKSQSASAIANKRTSLEAKALAKVDKKIRGRSVSWKMEDMSRTLQGVVEKTISSPKLWRRSKLGETFFGSAKQEPREHFSRIKANDDGQWDSSRCNLMQRDYLSCSRPSNLTLEHKGLEGKPPSSPPIPLREKIRLFQQRRSRTLDCIVRKDISHANVKSDENRLSTGSNDSNSSCFYLTGLECFSLEDPYDPGTLTRKKTSKDSKGSTENEFALLTSNQKEEDTRTSCEFEDSEKDNLSSNHHFEGSRRYSEETLVSLDTFASDFVTASQGLSVPSVLPCIDVTAHSPDNSTHLEDLLAICPKEIPSTGGE